MFLCAIKGAKSEASTKETHLRIILKTKRLQFGKRVRVRKGEFPYRGISNEGREVATWQNNDGKVIVQPNVKHLN